MIAHKRNGVRERERKKLVFLFVVYKTIKQVPSHSHSLSYIIEQDWKRVFTCTFHVCALLRGKEDLKVPSINTTLFKHLYVPCQSRVDVCWSPFLFFWSVHCWHDIKAQVHGCSLSIEGSVGGAKLSKIERGYVECQMSPGYSTWKDDAQNVRSI